MVVVENEKLQSDLKSKAADESLKEYTLRNSLVNYRYILEVLMVPFGHVSHILSLCVLQMNESMAANSHIGSAHSGLQKAEQTTWKNEMVRMMFLFCSPPPSLTHVVLSSHKMSAISRICVLCIPD